MDLDDKTRTELEAAVFRRLVDHLRLTVDEPVDETPYSLAHAALAQVTY